MNAGPGPYSERLRDRCVSDARLRRSRKVVACLSGDRASLSVWMAERAARMLADVLAEVAVVCRATAGGKLNEG